MFTLGLFGVLCGVVLWACFERSDKLDLKRENEYLKERLRPFERQRGAHGRFVHQDCTSASVTDRPMTQADLANAYAPQISGLKNRLSKTHEDGPYSEWEN